MKNYILHAKEAFQPVCDVETYESKRAFSAASALPALATQPAAQLAAEPRRRHVKLSGNIKPQHPPRTPTGVPQNSAKRRGSVSQNNHPSEKNLKESFWRLTIKKQLKRDSGEYFELPVCTEPALS